VIGVGTGGEGRKRTNGPCGDREWGHQTWRWRVMEDEEEEEEGNGGGGGVNRGEYL
jgi:hypothetical protein